MRTEAVLDIIVNSEIAFNKIIESLNNLICILVKQPLKFRHFLIVIKVLFVLRI